MKPIHKGLTFPLMAVPACFMCLAFFFPPAFVYKTTFWRWVVGAGIFELIALWSFWVAQEEK